MHKILSVPYIFFFQLLIKLLCFVATFLGCTVGGEYLKFNEQNKRKISDQLQTLLGYQSATGIPRLYLYSIISQRVGLNSVITSNKIKLQLQILRRSFVIKHQPLLLIFVDRQISSFCDLNHDLATNDIIFFGETVTQQQTSNNIFCAEILQQHAQFLEISQNT